MNNLLLWIMMLLLSNNLLAEDKKVEKTYTEAEFQAKVMEETKKNIEKIKTSSIVDLTKELVDKEAELKRKEQELKQREELLEKSNQDLVGKIKSFEDKKKKFYGCVAENEKKQDERVSQLVAVISQMKPAQAAEVLSVQDAGISVKILSKLSSKRASKIFNVMDKEVSARLQKDFLNMKQ